MPVDRDSVKGQLLTVNVQNSSGPPSVSLEVLDSLKASPEVRLTPTLPLGVLLRPDYLQTQIIKPLHVPMNPVR